MSDLTAERLAKLRKVAEAATPGEWTFYPVESSKFIECYIPAHVRLTDTDEHGRPRHRFVADCSGANLDNDANAAHIAAFSPPTALALLDAAQERNDARGERDAYMKSYFDCVAERDALRAQVEIARKALTQYANHQNWIAHDPDSKGAAVDWWQPTQGGWDFAEAALKEMG